ncbi:MAG: cob(I)yrinic acid a,c-diamide adenosyltransferase [Burkholderiales bacterium]|jgi:cob(I)alamin adenosyltransferase|nr:cob(I)yrinic acid a,c-diamide adenosyltransferase [Burkholderiales bacterium]
MANRLSKIVTRTGDDGTTGLSSGERIGKNRSRVAAMGDVDELNSAIGVLLCEPLTQAVREALTGIQHDLFDLGGELSLPGHTLVGETQVLRLDRLIEHFNSGLPPLREFVLPGGTRAAALAHVARTVCRRAERTLAALGAEESLQPQLLQYLNRLSDLLFVLARACNREGGNGDVLWQQGRNRG